MSYAFFCFASVGVCSFDGDFGFLFDSDVCGLYRFVWFLWGVLMELRVYLAGRLQWRQCVDDLYDASRLTYLYLRYGFAVSLVGDWEEW